jgi:molybdopterin/thiamine biosynthesis adenylyltransferase
VGSTAGRTRAAPGRLTGLSPRSSATDTSATSCCPKWAWTGQLKLLDSKVLLLGAGGLGSPAALYLAAAGVGTIGIIDMDVVDASNLQRQILHNMDRIGERKVDSAKKTLTAHQPRRQRGHLRRPSRG